MIRSCDRAPHHRARGPRQPVGSPDRPRARWGPGSATRSSGNWSREAGPDGPTATATAWAWWRRSPPARRLGSGGGPRRRGAGLRSHLRVGAGRRRRTPGSPCASRPLPGPTVRPRPPPRATASTAMVTAGAVASATAAAGPAGGCGYTRRRWTVERCGCRTRPGHEPERGQPARRRRVRRAGRPHPAQRAGPAVRAGPLTATELAHTTPVTRQAVVKHLAH